MSTHDLEGRAATRWCDGHEGAIRCALLMLLTLPGLSILYYGDEIGMVQPPAEILKASSLDTPEGGRRDASRTPMQWDETLGAGFTDSPHPWLPAGDPTRASVAGQRNDPGSVLRLCRDLIALRRSEPVLVEAGNPVSAHSADDAGLGAGREPGRRAQSRRRATRARDARGDHDLHRPSSGRRAVLGQAQAPATRGRRRPSSGDAPLGRCSRDLRAWCAGQCEIEPPGLPDDEKNSFARPVFAGGVLRFTPYLA